MPSTFCGVSASFCGKGGPNEQVRETPRLPCPCNRCDRLDTAAALQHKTQQAMNFYLWREAMEARTEADKIVKYTKKFRKKSVREAMAKAGNGYLEQIDGLLDRFEFVKSMRQVDRDNIETWAQVRAEAGDNIQLTKEALNEAMPRYSELRRASRS